MGEGLVDVVLVVETEAAHVDGVNVGRVLPEEVVGHLLGLAVPPQKGQTLGAQKL